MPPAPPPPAASPAAPAVPRATPAPTGGPAPEVLPALLLSRYLFFLTQRPISASNTHYLQQRIRGLQSLGVELGVTDGVTSALLRSLTPTTLREIAERLQLHLLPSARAELAPRFVVADTALPPDFLGDADRVLIAFGPAIGIGDEIICLPLPSWLKAANPAADVTVLSSYEGLWDRVSGVDRVRQYPDDARLLAALRGREEPADVVILVDFENPELYRAVAGDPAMGRYVELSLGARVLTAVDNRDHWVYRPPPITGYFANFYDALTRLAAAAGLPAVDTPARFATLTGPRRALRNAAGRGELVLYACPFTSKYDPSLRYWIRLLRELVPADPAAAVRIVLDPGATPAARHFSAQLAAALVGHPAGAAVAVELARPDRRHTLSIRGVLAELSRVDVVVCTDSFTAHAAPLLDCTTMVLARPGLRNWRAPHPRSFSFDGERPLPETVAGMRQILGHHGVLRPPDRQLPPLGARERRLVDAAGELGRLFDGVDGGRPDLDRAQAAHGRFAAARDAVVRGLPRWPSGARALLWDEPYDVPLRRLDGASAVPPAVRTALLNHVEHDWLCWRNSNLYKYLALASEQAW